MREITRERLRAAWRNARRGQRDRLLEASWIDAANPPSAEGTDAAQETVLLLGGPRHGSYITLPVAMVAAGARVDEGLFGYVLDEMHVGRRVAFPYFFDRHAKVQAIRHWWRRPE